MKRLRLIATWIMLATVCVPVLAWAATAFVTLDGPVAPGWNVKWGTSKDPRFRHLVVKLNEKVDGIDSVVGNVGALHDRDVQWATREAFVEAFDPGPEAARDAQLMASPPTSEPPATLTKLEGAVINDTVKIDGVEFWHIAYPASGYYVDYIRTPGASQASAQWVKVEETWQEFYYAPLPDGTAAQLMISATTDAKHLDRLPSLKAEAQQILKQMRFDFTGNGVMAGSGPEQPAAPGTLPWRSVSGGMAAVAAAAIALAGAAASSTSKGSKPDAKKPIGYVLQLSARELAVASKQSTSFEATAWRVLGSGALQPANDVTVSLSPPFGIDAQPASGAGSVKALVWQIGEPAAGASLRVSAVGSAGGTSADVALQTEAATCLRVTLQPTGRGPLMPDGKDSLLVSASVQLAPHAAADPTIDVEAVRRSISFVAPNQSEWLNVGTERDEPGGKSVPVSASNPDTRQTPNPPASVSLMVTALVGTEQLSQSVSIPVARPPVLDARPDVLQFSAGSRQTADVTVSVEPPGESAWEFRCERREGDRALVETGVQRLSPASATLTVAEAVGDQPPGDRASETVELWVVAESSAGEPLRRRVQVTIAREGVYIDGLGRDADGTFHIAADGSGTPTDIDVRVFVRDEGGRIGFDPRLSQALSVEPAEDGEAPSTLRVAQVVHTPAGIRPSNSPSAIHRFSTQTTLPTSGKPVPATYVFRAPERDEAAFSQRVAVSLLGVNMAPFSPAWSVEYERCVKIIDTYIPAEERPRFHSLLAERGKTFGAEGLFELRKRIWSYAETRLQQEIHEQLDIAWQHEQVEGFLDWVSWCGDIAMGVASGSLVGTGAAVAVGSLKPVLVSAMTAWVNGHSIDQWAREQLGILASVVEGAATDIDLLAKLGGGNRIAAWTAFLSYYFVKELATNPEQSVVQAMKNVAAMVRDQALTSFLRTHAGTSPRGSHADAEPHTATAKAAGAAKAAQTAVGTRVAAAGAAGAKPPVGRPARTPDASAPAAATPDARAPRPTPGPVPPAAPAPEATTKTTADPAARPEPQDAAPEPATKPAPEAPATAPEKPATTPEKPAGTDAKKPPVGPPVEIPVRGKPMNGRQAAALVRKGMRSENGVLKADLEAVERVMSDPDAAREMRRADPEAYQAYDNARAELRVVHDQKLKQHVEKLPWLEGKKVSEVRVETVGTEGGIDRDFRVLAEVPDPRNRGKTMWLEVPKEQWRAQSDRIFAEQTGGPKDPEGAREWATEHQQLGTDKFDAEAAIDMSDQAWQTNPETGKLERVQVPSRLSEVLAGNGTLLDPDGLGKTFQTKVADSSAAGPLDGYAQAKKAADTLEAVRDKYSEQGYGVGELDPNVRSGMAIIRQVADGKLKAADGDSLLAGKGLGDLGSFMEKVSSQFASLKWAKK